MARWHPSQASAAAAIATSALAAPLPPPRWNAAQTAQAVEPPPPLPRTRSPQPPPVEIPVAGPASSAPAAAPDGGAPPDPAQALLASARAKRARIVQQEQQPTIDTAAVAADAQSCAADAHRSWAAQFPEAAAMVDPAQAGPLIGLAGAEALYLEAVCTATWARMQGFTPLIERRGAVMAALVRVAQLAPGLDGAGADRELGALYAALPAYAGGDLDAARKHLLEAIARAPQDARNHLVLARTVAVKAQERALFREHLGIAAKSSDPLAKAEAEALLQRENDLFGPAEAAQPVPGGPQK